MPHFRLFGAAPWPWEIYGEEVLKLLMFL